MIFAYYFLRFQFRTKEQERRRHTTLFCRLHANSFNHQNVNYTVKKTG